MPVSVHCAAGVEHDEHRFASVVAVAMLLASDDCRSPTYRQQRIDVGRFPMHPRSFASSLHDHFVGTFHHPGSDGPALSLKLKRVHLSPTFAHIPQNFTDR